MGDERIVLSDLLVVCTDHNQGDERDEMELGPGGHCTWHLERGAGVRPTTWRPGRV